MAWQPFYTFQHETGCCYLNVHCHMFDNSPGLKTFTCTNSVIVLAPPIAKRKCHVLFCNVLLLAGLPYPPQLWPEKPRDLDDNMLQHLSVFIQWRYRGGVANSDVLPAQRKLLLRVKGCMETHKFDTHIRSVDKLYLKCVLVFGVAQWLNSPTYKNLTN